MECCFFDYNATSPLRPEARAAWLAATDDLWLNPSSPYRAAARVHAHLNAARARVAELFEVAPERVVFNSGATEGNNAVFAHWAATLPADARVAVSPTEHPSVVEAAKQTFGERVDWLMLDVHGAVDLAALQELLNQGKVMALSVMAANNETGILNDWQRIAEECRAQGVQTHCDASQWIGKLPLSGLGAGDFVTGCAHKFGGPRGVGLVLLPEANAGFTSLLGGAQESGHRAGTEDVAGVLAMVAALEEVEHGSAEGRDIFLEELSQVMPSVEVVGLEVERLWNTALLILPEFASVRWIRALERRGFLVSAGSACSTGKQGVSPVLAAMGLEADVMRRVLRVSSGWATSVEDWRALAVAIVECYATLRSEADRSPSTVISI
ncbi:MULTISPECIES: cysteine desulfurase family protein [unclassified Lentimonas]|uniref:cysteine desulfurase family protein n=1 Tax=unclassified Lentimonas TaxID=2630993 RepID=UPI001325F549|nr:MULTISPECIES: aminotransferase class V-fold PLP-dependent enzyme [unclassified Lentimonas]CAA6690415.1 Cysteine desulfurase (EC [Lentimonas sp. CC19]CAA6693890.1 Cysteine desulfurase (EC [Lentimonas sp. CC10]CAA7068619.1 Cysteine desulfurase (EC [Lentimonas sp. CC11]